MAGGNNFKQHLLKLLSATGYGLKLKPEDLTIDDNDPKMREFYQWFCSYIFEENCLTMNELSEFQKLEESNDVLYGEELDKALESHFSTSPLSVGSVVESTLQATKEELSVLQEQYKVKTQLLSTVNASVLAVTEDIKKLKREVKEAEDWNTMCATNVLSLLKPFNDKLDEIKQLLESGRRKFSVLAHNNELSADEGIDTLTSDNLDSSFSSISTISTIASSAPLTETSSSYKFFCQIPLEKYEKQDRLFNKVIEKLLHCKQKLKKKADDDLEIDLELMNILDRLTKQKRKLIWNAAEIEGLKAAQQTIDEINREFQLGRGKQVISRIKSDVAESMDHNESGESFTTKEVEDLDDCCKTWAESRVLKWVSVLWQQKVEDYDVLINQLDELKKDLKLKYTADRVFQELLEFEGDTVEKFFEIHRRVDSMIKELVADTKRRIEIMEENLQDYREYQKIPLEDRYESIGWLATVLGSEKTEIVQAMRELSEHLEYQHKSLTEHFQQQMQTLVEKDQQLMSCFESQVRNKKPPQTSEDTSLDLYQTVNTHFNIMNNLIEETKLNLNLNQQRQVYEEEESEVDKLLQERINQLKKE